MKRREFLQKAAKTLGFGAAAIVPGPWNPLFTQAFADSGLQKEYEKLQREELENKQNLAQKDPKYGLSPQALERLVEILDPKNYNKRTKDWDLVYGPPIFNSHFYQGLHNSEGHARNTVPVNGIPHSGIDYNIHMYTPLVPALTSRYHRAYDNFHPRAGRTQFFVELNKRFGCRFSHLDMFVIGREFEVTKEPKPEERRMVRYLKRNEIVALSGNDCTPASIGHPPVLHFNVLDFIDSPKKTDANTKRINILVDRPPERNTIDSDYRKDAYPVFWDCWTLLDFKQRNQFPLLRSAIANLEGYTQKWTKDHDTQEIAGKLVELAKGIGKVSDAEIISSSKFSDMKDIVRKAVLEPQKEQKKFGPGSGPYTAMLQILGYGKEVSQGCIATLPFIPPALLHLYKVPQYTQGILLKDGEYYNNGKLIDRWEPEVYR